MFSYSCIERAFKERRSNKCSLHYTLYILHNYRNPEADTIGSADRLHSATGRFRKLWNFRLIPNSSMHYFSFARALPSFSRSFSSTSAIRSAYKMSSAGMSIYTLAVSTPSFHFAPRNLTYPRKPTQRQQHPLQNRAKKPI